MRKAVPSKTIGAPSLDSGRIVSDVLPTDFESEALMPDFPAIHHVALTVGDLGRSVPWYQALIGADPVIDEDTGPFRHVVWLVGGTLIGLHQFSDSDPGGDFDEHRLGLDHLAFACADRAELESWQSHLDGLGIPHGGIFDHAVRVGAVVRDPDNLPLEFFAPPG